MYEISPFRVDSFVHQDDLMKRTWLTFITAAMDNQPSSRTEAPSAGRMPLLGDTTHDKVMADLQITAQPVQMAVHQRSVIGGEVDLAPTRGDESSVTLALDDGDKMVLFTVHTKLLCYYSPHFHSILDKGGVMAKAQVRPKMLRREWRWELEGDMDTFGSDSEENKVPVDVRIKLPGDPIRQVVLNKGEIGDVGPRAVAAFVDWLYKGFMGFTSNDFGRMKYTSSELIQLWVFAGHIGVPACQNDCIEGIEFIRQQTNTVNTGMIAWIYENTRGVKHEEKLKRLLLDQCVWKIDGALTLAGGLGDEKCVPREALVHLFGRVMTMMQSNVSIWAQPPPFSQLEWRKSLYWIEDYVQQN